MTGQRPADALLMNEQDCRRLPHRYPSEDQAALMDRHQWQARALD